MSLPSLEELKNGTAHSAEKRRVEWKPIDLSVQVEDPHPLLKQGENILFSPGNLSTIGGKAKSKKTFLACGVAAAFLSGECLGLTGQPLKGKETCLVIDTEQALPHVHRVAKRIHRLCGWLTNENNDRLVVVSLREHSTADRVEVLKETIEKLIPGLVILDGVRDLAVDFNSAQESSDLVNLIMKLTSQHQTHIICILHENKGDGNLRGHLGSELVNKSETVLSVAKDGDISIVTPTMTRNMPFEDFAFRVNESGLPELADTFEKYNPKREQYRKAFSSILQGQTSKSYPELWKEFCEVAGVSERTAKTRISEALNEGFISKTSAGYYILKNRSDANANDIPF